MNNILDIFKNNPNVTDILSKISGSKYSLFCTGMTPNVNALLASVCYLNKNLNNKPIVYVCENEYKANVMYDAITDIIGVDGVTLYVVDDFASVEAVAISSELKQERLNTIMNISIDSPKVIVTHTAGIIKPIISQRKYEEAIISLEKAAELDQQYLAKKLTELGYERVPATYNTGQFSLRGEVIDIFPCFESDPIRISVVFDEIESIKKFDAKSQLSNTESSIDKIKIYPMNEIILDFNIDDFEKSLLEICNNDYILSDFEKIRETQSYEKLLKYIKYFDNEYSTLLDYLKNKFDDYIIFYDEINNIEEVNKKIAYEVSEYIDNRVKTKGLDLIFYDDLDSVRSGCDKVIYLSNVKKGLQHVELYGLYNFNSFKVVNYENDLKALAKDLKSSNKKVYITLKDEKQMEMLDTFLTQEDVAFECAGNFFDSKEKVSLVLCNNGIGYGILDEYIVLSDNQIFKSIRKQKTKYRSVLQNSVGVVSKDELNIGDYVVHYEYGIGKYLGIKTVELNSIKNDYLQIQYANMDLLIPMDKISDLEKYLGSEGVVPKLTKVGTNEWEKKKNAVREQLESIAKDLIELQVKRQSMKGFKYSCDSSMQELFENDFSFDETNDQNKIIDEIKNEMEEGVLIDRLVCGDVGFGKTEIAMRAAFKTVFEGKQVAYLAPTTILTKQHFETFKSRFDKYGVKVALLNRLIPIPEQNRIINDLKVGKIDIVIGTHRLLSNEIKYNDLGLLIIDEEQRFGVEHKETIKRMKDNVNVITLTATPIPRTLQMAVTGIRTLSLLETPPKDRYPIQTYVLEYDEVIIKEAIYRELARKGQVFYLHNRISDIDLVARKIEKLIPEAKVCVGHGRMTRDELEEVIMRYIEGDYNVLVCTTIIETGIDIPNSNTLIIDDASKLGLAQMYQIRGRVGRSDRIAYAYLLYKPDKVLNKNAAKRLSSIKEYNTIGSGYKIAIRDLAIRGAGDILGREQSGFINSIGIDMYMKLLNEAVNKAKGIETPKKVNYRINVSKHVEREYVSDETIIIYIHKEINSINNINDKYKTISELTDRFGKLSRTVLDYVEERYLESLLRLLNIKDIKEEENEVIMVIPEEFSKKLRGDVVMMSGYKISSKFKFIYKKNEFIVYLQKEKNDRSWIYLLTKFIEKIKNV